MPAAQRLGFARMRMIDQIRQALISTAILSISVPGLSAPDPGEKTTEGEAVDVY